MILMMHTMMGAATVPPASGSAFDPSAFVFTIRVENDGDPFTWPHRPGGVYDATFDWGDGSSDHVTAEPGEHVYASAGDYDVSVTGACPAPISASGSDWRAALIAIKQWGQLGGADNWSNGFSSLDHELSIQATDPFGAGVTNMQRMFQSTTFTGDLSNWDVSSVDTMQQMFDNSTFTSDLSGWDVSSATQMARMFYLAVSFDSDLTGWCVQHITSEPSGFASGSALQPQHYPVWGTCP